MGCFVTLGRINHQGIKRGREGARADERVRKRVAMEILRERRGVVQRRGGRVGNVIAVCTVGWTRIYAALAIYSSTKKKKGKRRKEREGRKPENKKRKNS